jgi:hypothetical protein
VKRGIHNESNDSGTHLINFAVNQHVGVGGPLFSHETIYKGTQKSAGGTTINQTLHVCTDQQHCINLFRCPTFLEFLILILVTVF